MELCISDVLHFRHLLILEHNISATKDEKKHSKSNLALIGSVGCRACLDLKGDIPGQRNKSLHFEPDLQNASNGHFRILRVSGHDNNVFLPCTKLYFRI